MSTEPGAPASNQGGGGGGPPAGGTSTLRLGMKKMEGGGQGGVGEAESLELASREEKGSTKEARSGREGGRKEGHPSPPALTQDGFYLLWKGPQLTPACLADRPRLAGAGGAWELETRTPTRVGPEQLLKACAPGLAPLSHLLR